jgi:hypothetical protein
VDPSVDAILNTSSSPTNENSEERATEAGKRAAEKINELIED